MISDVADDAASTQVVPPVDLSIVEAARRNPFRRVRSQLREALRMILRRDHSAAEIHRDSHDAYALRSVALTLTVTEWAAFTLATLGELSIREIGQRIGRSAGHVSRLIRTARRKAACAKESV